MLFAVVVSMLVAAIAVCVVVMFQAFATRAKEFDLEQKRLVAEYARTTKGIVTPLMVAEHLRLSPEDADRLLRSMVDDVHMRMAVDDQEGVLKFWFTQLSDLEQDRSVPLGRSESRRRRD